MSWRDDAACKGQVALFTSHKGAAAAVQRAKAICATCPVLPDCREDWFKARDEIGYSLPGVWFGTSEAERSGRAVRHGKETAYRNGCRCDPCVENRRRLDRERAARYRLGVAS